MIDQEKGLSSADWQQLKGMTARFEQICTDLAAFCIQGGIVSCPPSFKARGLHCQDAYQGITRMEGAMREEYAWIVPELLMEFLYHEKMLLG